MSPTSAVRRGGNSGVVVSDVACHAGAHRLVPPFDNQASKKYDFYPPPTRTYSALGILRDREVAARP